MPLRIRLVSLRRPLGRARRKSSLRLEASGDEEADIIVKRGGRVEELGPAVTPNVANISIMPEEASGVLPGADGGALAVEASLDTEGGILFEQRRSIRGVNI